MSTSRQREGHERHDVVIVGAGPTGVAMLHALSKEPTGVGSVRLIDPISPGFGMAFGEKCAADPDLLCNTPVGLTSIDGNNPDDLADYLTGRGWPVSRDDVVPRLLIGEYCHQRYLEAKARLEGLGIPVLRTPERAQSVECHGQGEYSVHLGDGGTVRGSVVLLCTGLETQKIPGMLEPYAASPRLLGAYPAVDLRNLPAGATVLLVGMRVSALDAALVLAKSGHPVVVTSPSGQLPSVRERLCADDTPYFDRDRMLATAPDDPELEAVFTEIVLAAVDATAGELERSAMFSPLVDAEDRLRHEIELAEGGYARWSYLIYEASNLINDIALGWTAEQQSAGLAKARPFMSRYLTSLPILNARRLMRDIDRGLSRLSPHFPVGIAGDDDGWTVDWPDGTRERYDYVVLATGYHFPRFVFESADRIAIDSSGATDNLVPVDSSLRLHLDADGPAENIWALGAASNQRIPVAHVIWIAAQEARDVAAEVAKSGRSGLDDRLASLSVGQSA